MTNEEGTKAWIDNTTEWMEGNLTGTIMQAMDTIKMLLDNMKSEIESGNVKMAFNTLDSLMQETAHYAKQAHTKNDQLDILHQVQAMMKH